MVKAWNSVICLFTALHLKLLIWKNKEQQPKASLVMPVKVLSVSFQLYIQNWIPEPHSSRSSSLRPVNPPPREPPARLRSQRHPSTSLCPGCRPPAAATTCRSAAARATWREPSRPSTSASPRTRARLRRWPPPTWTASRVRNNSSFSVQNIIQSSWAFKEPNIPLWRWYRPNQINQIKIKEFVFKVLLLAASSCSWQLVRK